jgi:hypothetical protein
VKITACILLAALVSFVTETIKIPLTCPESKKTETCSGCKMMSMHKQQCSNNEQKKSGDSNTSAKCVDCPLFSMFGYQAFILLQQQSSFIKKEYSLIQVSHLADYSIQLLRPPNIGKCF